MSCSHTRDIKFIGHVEAKIRNLGAKTSGN
jgi:hypothetical protein